MLDRKTAPSYSHSHTLELPLIEELKVSDELTVLYFDQVKQALTKVEFIYKAGKWYESFSGLSHFTAQMLEKGTAKKNSTEIASVFDQLGAHVEITPGFDYTSISLYSLSEKLKDVMPLFLEIIQSSSFPEEELDLMKGIFAQNLKVNNDKTSYIASKLIRRNLFGSTHPYGSSIEESDVSKINREGTSRFFKECFHPHEIYITGQLTNAQLDFLIKEIGSISSRSSKNNAIKHTLKEGAKVDYFEKAESLQTSIRLGKRTINKTHKDFNGLLFLNHILGGYFGSRLMKNIREEKGLTYGIYSSINTFLNDSFFVIGADVNKENQEITITEIKNELKKLYSGRISEQELLIAKNHFIGSIQLDMANPFSVVEKIKNVRLNHLNPAYYPNLISDVSNINQEQLISIAEKYFSPSDFLIAKAG
jgi:zinc protease